MLSADQHIERAFRENAECHRIGAVESIGPVTATAVAAAISDGIPAAAKHNCWVISKRGDPYLRTLLVQWSQVGGLSAKTKIDCRQPVDQRQTTKTWNSKSL